MFTREELGNLSDFLDKCATRFSDFNVSDEIAAELWGLAIDVVNAKNAHVTDDNVWIWHGQYHWPSWHCQNSFDYILDCSCGKTFKDMIQVEAIKVYFEHVKEA